MSNKVKSHYLFSLYVWNSLVLQSRPDKSARSSAAESYRHHLVLLVSQCGTCCLSRTRDAAVKQKLEKTFTSHLLLAHFGRLLTTDA